MPCPLCGVGSSTGANVTRYLLDLQPGLAVVLAATTGATTNGSTEGHTDRYVHGPRGIHAQQINAGAWQHTLQDGLGSVRAVIDNNVATLNQANYSAYGTPDAAIGSPFAFTGEQRDGSGLQYHRARYYAPGLGVWASEDPLEGMAGRPMSLNGYSWVEGNVVNAGDPSGMIGERERHVILWDSAGWLESASRINVLAITGLSNEAFAVMIAAKFLAEDATCANDDPPFADGCRNQIGGSPGIGALREMIDPNDEVSYGPANIPLRQARSAAEFWIALAQNPCFDVDLENFHSQYLRNPTDSILRRELYEGLMGAAGWELFWGGTRSPWYEWLGVTILQSAYRAKFYAQNQNNMISGWVTPRTGDMSAYIIALGQVGYNETDQTLYDLSKWTGKGFAFDWVNGMRSIIDDQILRERISWLPQSVTWLEWTPQELERLGQLS